MTSHNSIFNLFTIGIGPSSSHTVGPMKAARRFLLEARDHKAFSHAARVSIELFGSLAFTGKGHGTDNAILLGLQGEIPSEIDPDSIESTLQDIRANRHIRLLGEKPVPFSEKGDMIFHFKDTLPYHPNGMRFSLYDTRNKLLYSDIYYSVGGGAIVSEQETASDSPDPEVNETPYPFSTAEELLQLGREHGLAIHEIVLENEKCWQDEDTIRERLLQIWQAMQDCVIRGLHSEGILPGGLKVQRRAPGVYQKLIANPENSLKDPLTIIDWVNLYALAVNEENAAGGRVVTAPTNGAAGIIPAVMHYYARLTPNPDQEGILRFLLTAGAIGILYKKNASISGAEVGCQGEVGVACSMAAGGLVAALGGRNDEIEHAAEIGMEHNLGLTCDPVGGLVQIPCIERNAMGAVKAINAARMAMQSTGAHKVSLDQVIATMRQTGQDMKTHYKETSLGGLAVNVIEC